MAVSDEFSKCIGSSFGVTGSNVFTFEINLRNGWLLIKRLYIYQGLFETLEFGTRCLMSCCWLFFDHYNSTFIYFSLSIFLVDPG